jgi:hypothetical protein
MLIFFSYFLRKISIEFDESCDNYDLGEFDKFDLKTYEFKEMKADSLFVEMRTSN